MEHAQRYFALRAAKEEAEAQLEAIKEELQQTEKDLVLSMENDNVTKFTDATYGTVYLREQVYARIENEEQAFAWFRGNGLQDMLKLSIHNKTLVAVAKDNPEIPGVITAYETKIGYRKS